MKKIIAIFLVLALNLPLAMADLAPDYNIFQTVVPGKNIINVFDYPDWVFYQYVFKAGEYSYELINEDGNLGCNSGSFSYGVEVWAIKKDKAGELLLLSRAITEQDLKDVGGINLYENERLPLVGCSNVVSKRFKEEFLLKNIIITPEMLGVVDSFEFDTTLTQKNQDILKSAIYDSFTKFQVNIETLSEEKQKIAYGLIISKIDSMLKTEKRDAFIFTLSYLKFLAQNSLNG